MVRISYGQLHAIKCLSDDQLPLLPTKAARDSKQIPGVVRRGLFEGDAASWRNAEADLREILQGSSALKVDPEATHATRKTLELCLVVTHPMLHSSASGPEIGLPGGISAGL